MSGEHGGPGDLVDDLIGFCVGDWLDGLDEREREEYLERVSLEARIENPFVLNHVLDLESQEGWVKDGELQEFQGLEGADRRLVQEYELVHRGEAEAVSEWEERERERELEAEAALEEQGPGLMERAVEEVKKGGEFAGGIIGAGIVWSALWQDGRFGRLANDVFDIKDPDGFRGPRPGEYDDYEEYVEAEQPNYEQVSHHDDPDYSMSPAEWKAKYSADYDDLSDEELWDAGL